MVSNRSIRFAEYKPFFLFLFTKFSLNFRSLVLYYIYHEKGVCEMSKRKKTRSFICTIVAFTLILSASLLSSCKDEEKSNDLPKLESSSPYLSMELSEYISIDAYTSLDIIAKEGDDKASLIMNALADAARVIKYPEDQVNYYYAQTKQMYMDLASGDEEKYREILSEQKITEETMLEDAREMVKQDLIFYYVVKDADISLTDEEISSLYGQYVDYYVETYKYSESYVKENMSSLIYDSMLYDKTMEYLILNNNFVTEND